MNQSEILRWSLMHSTLMLVLLPVVYFTGQPHWIVLGASISVLCYCWLGRQQLGHSGLIVGRANSITLIRFFAVSAVALIYPTEHPYIVALVFLACVCLDGIDGYLARKYDESTEFGQYLDMETDAYSIYLITSLLWQYNNFTIFLTIAGTLRYSYNWLVRVSVGSAKAEPKRLYASVVAVLFYLSMNSAIVITNAYSKGLVYILMAALFLSFIRSYLYQWKSKEA